MCKQVCIALAAPSVLVMPKLRQVWLWSFDLMKTLDFIRPFLVMPKLRQVWLWSFDLTKTLDFIRPFLAKADIKQAWSALMA